MERKGSYEKKQGVASQVFKICHLYFPLRETETAENNKDRERKRERKRESERERERDREVDIAG